jgi:hypothetical protein
MLEHNYSKLIIPGCFEGKRNELKRAVRLCELKERERALLAWVLDQSDAWTITVKQIRKEMQWGEDKWATVRRSLVGHGILQQVKEKRNGGHVWHLIFDLHSVPGFDLSTGDIKTPVSCARANDTYEKPRDRATPRYTPVSRDALENPGVVILKGLPKPPPQAKVGGEFETLRVQASQDQRRILDALLASPPETVRDLNAWRIGLARRAAEGQLTEPSAAVAVVSKLVKDKSLIGWTTTCPQFGKLNITRALDFVAHKNGCSLDICGDDADRIWRRINRRELVFCPPILQ